MQYQVVNEQNKERAVLAGVSSTQEEKKKLTEYLDELAFLVDTAGGIPVKRFTQHLQSPNRKTFVGSGKLEEIRDFITENDIDMIVFDDELTTSQMRNIEKRLKCKILDRTNLILDIFAKRARTSYAKTQVELAQYEYLLPRLAGMWTHLERQRGGIGVRGPGEREIETDRRIIRDKISLLKKKLERIDKQKTVQRSNRGNMVRAALVGYTNVGKSTLMNNLCKTDLFAEDKLFATLDTTVRKITIDNLPFLMTDTVGFIRKLPHSLIESFKSTLDEVREADLILHMVDISHPDFEDHINIVQETLADINVIDKPSILVFNKIDAYNNTDMEDDNNGESDHTDNNIEQLKKSWMSKINLPCIFISAKTKENTGELKKILYEEVKKIHTKRWPYNNVNIRKTSYPLSNT